MEVKACKKTQKIYIFEKNVEKKIWGYFFWHPMGKLFFGCKNTRVKILEL